jgi:hypothetical protein
LACSGRPPRSSQGSLGSAGGQLREPSCSRRSDHAVGHLLVSKHLAKNFFI